MLSGTSLAIINGMSAIGYEIANGNETGQRSQSSRDYVWLSERASMTYTSQDFAERLMSPSGRNFAKQTNFAIDIGFNHRVDSGRLL